jgi:hypothetical protein
LNFGDSAFFEAPLGTGSEEMGSEEMGFSNRSSPVNSILRAIAAGSMVLFVIGAFVRHIMAFG